MWYAQCPACSLWISLSQEKNITDMFSLEEIEVHVMKVHGGKGLSRIAFVELRTKEELRPEEIYNADRKN